jgi:parallel beta-helix repeat protein
MNDSPRAGLSTWQSSVTVENCRFDGNGLFGLYVVESSNFDGYGLTISDNGKYGLWVSRGSIGYCTGCVLENNRYAAVSYMGSFVTVLQSVVNAPRGIWAAFYSYIDFDCYSRRDDYPEYPDCRLDASDWAAVGQIRSESVMYVSGGFTGRLWAEQQSRVRLLGAQQESTEGINNYIFDTSALEVAPFFEPGGGPLHESMLNGHTLLQGFARAYLADETTLDGIVECRDASDAWADDAVSFTGGSGFCECEHAPEPESCPEEE